VTTGRGGKGEMQMEGVAPGVCRALWPRICRQDWELKGWGARALAEEVQGGEHGKG